MESSETIKGGNEIMLLETIIFGSFLVTLWLTFVEAFDIEL